MSNSVPPRTSIPSRIPTSGSGGTPYIIASLVLVAIIAAVLWFKFRGSSGSAPTPAATPSVSVTQAPPPVAFDLPPPPPLETLDAGDDGGKKVAASGTLGGGTCGSPCQGTETPALVSALRGTAGSARGCYERALRTSSMLQGRLKVAVRVGGNGSVCSASIVEDGLHSGEVSSCVLGLFRGRPFPAPGGGSCVDVTVPLSFTPQEKK